MITSDDVRSWGHSIRDQLGLQEFELWLDKANNIKLQMIAVPKDKRKEGLGSQALKLLTDYADKNNLKIILDLGVKDKHWGTTSRTRLMDFYKRFGFIRNFGSKRDFTITADMLREPKGNVVKKKTFMEFLAESPIGDYELLGKWDKGSSFKDKRDRAILQHPKSIERTRKKFDNSDILFNFYFVNSKEAKQHQEIGVVDDIHWVEENLGKDVAQAVSKNLHDDSINIIFTNNDGSERMPMTAWIIAHRIGHAVARVRGGRDMHGQYVQASNHLVSSFSAIVNDYYVGRAIDSDSEYKIVRSRPHQLVMKKFFSHVATFKSARDGNIRDWFEVLNELIAQYLTTGKIKFNKPPSSFSAGPSSNKMNYHLKKDSMDGANEMIEMLARDMEMFISDIFSTMHNRILVM